MERDKKRLDAGLVMCRAINTLINIAAINNNRNLRSRANQVVCNPSGERVRHEQ